MPNNTGAARDSASYAERVGPSPWGYLVAVILGVVFGVIWIPVELWLAPVMGVLGVATAVLFMVFTSASVQVHDVEVEAGRAHIDAAFLGEPRVVERDEFSRLIGADIDPAAYLCIRDAVRRGVLLPIVDDQDPTPYWLVSSRHPEALAAAVEAARDRAVRTSPDGTPTQTQR